MASRLAVTDALPGSVCLMVDRPQGPEPGTPEYEWLYGKSRPQSDDDATQIIPQGQVPPTANRPDPGPEHTQVMPSAEPYRTPPPPGQQPNTAQPNRPLAPPPGQQPPSGGGRGFGVRRPRFRPLRWLMLLLLLWLAFLIATPIFAFNKISTVDAFPSGDRPDDQDGTTYLVVGSDSRADLSKEERKKLGTGGDVGQRTDTIMLLHTGKGPNLLMSIPRDSLVEIPGHGTAKINGTTNPDAYKGGGPKLLIETIEHNTGIKIDHYVEIGFGGFVDVVDAVGGIEICPTKDMTDKQANLKIEKGCQEADGVTALGYARSRKTDPQFGDITRAKHQREVVSAVGSKAVSPWSVINPIRYWKLNMAAARTVKVSEGTGPIDLGRFAWAMTRVDGDNGLTCGVPISDLAVHWDAERSKEMFEHIKDDDTEGISNDLCTETGLKD